MISKIIKAEFNTTLLSVQNIARGFFTAEFNTLESVVEAASMCTVEGEGKTL